MARASWYSDPTGRHQHRYWNGSSWTDNTADNGVTSRDPIDDAEQKDLSPPEAAATGSEAALAPEPEKAEASESETEEAAVLGGDEGSDVQESVPVVAVATASPASASRREWTFRRWHVVAALVAIVLVAAAIGAASQQSQIDELKDQKSTLAEQKARVIDERDAAQEKVADRAAQVAADKAKADRITAEQKAAADKAAADQKAAADKAAADAKATADKAAADAAAAADAQAKAEAVRNTIPGNGTFAIGTDKNPGRYQSPGASGCYFAVRSTPNGFEGILDNGNPDGPQIVDLAAGQFLESARCATWTRIG